MDVAALAASGKQSFRAERYEEAANEFTIAIELEKDASKLASLLDSRAACYERLDKKRSALEDAKEVIKLKPELAKGYLRASRIYESIGKQDALEAALRIVQAGRKSVRQAEEKLVEAEKRLLAALGKKAASPLANLPKELFVETVSYLSPMQRYRCTRVCRIWRQTIFESPDLWNDLELGGNLDADQAMLKAEYWVERLGDCSLKSLLIDFEVSASTAKNRMKRLYSLLAPATHSLENLTYGDPLPMPDMTTTSILAKSFWRFVLPIVTLQSLEMSLHVGMLMPVSLSDLTNAFAPLRRLVVIRRGTGGAFLPVSDKACPVERFAANQGSRSCSLRQLRLDALGFSPAAGSPGTALLDFSSYRWPALQELECSRAQIIPYVFGIPGHALVAALGSVEPKQEPLSLPCLRRLSIQRPSNMMGQSITLVVNITAPALSHLSHTGFDSAQTSLALTHVAKHSPKLEELVVTGCALRNDGKVLVELSWPELRYLNISNTSFSDAAITALVESAPKLEALIANGCTALTSGPVMRFVKDRKGELKELAIDACILVTQDAVNWLRQVVPKLSAKMGTGADKTWRGKFT